MGGFINGVATSGNVSVTGVTSGTVTTPNYLPYPTPCPSCGHCPSCGRGAQTQPYYWPAYPQWQWNGNSPWAIPMSTGVTKFNAR
jgi:hypothetical protein